MEEAAVAVQRFAEVLAVARSPWAADWDTAAVGRAFQWARYLEQLSRRLEGQGQGQREAWRRLQLQLRPETRAPLPHPLPGFRGLRLEELGRGRQMLGQALLCNPASSAAAFHRAAAWFRAGCGEERAAAAALRRAARLAAAARVLQLAGGGDDTERAARVTQAEVLRQLRRERRGELPEEVWRRAVSADAGCWRPLAALLTAEDGDEPAAARPGLPGDGAARRGLLGDSAARPGLPGDSTARPGLPGDSRALADAACRELPCPLLSELAASRPPFARRYTAHLQRWAARMQYDAGSGRWLHPDSPEQDWEKLLQHFAGLLQGPPATRESTLRTLNSLKAADGDFEVWGISVWTDLLLALKQQKVV